MRRLSWIFLAACGTPDEPAPEAPVVVQVEASSFGCITEMTPVRGFYVDNLLGDLDATLGAANAPQNATWPAGSVVQLVPGEAMVKREAGFSATTDDWEFFYLKTTDAGTEILDRGTDDVVNAFQGNCASCHAAAQAEWDWICEQDHGCVDLPLSADAIRSVQENDPRCP